MAQSQDGRDTVQEWVHKQKERNQEKKRKIQRNQRKELGLGLTVTMNQLLLSAWNILVALRMWDDHWDDHADAIALGVVRAQM